ncbi:MULTISPECIES: type II toxin-antitoxin system PemK/MazF family toxin [unclassified Modestobacter]
MTSGWRGVLGRLASAVRTTGAPRRARPATTRAVTDPERPLELDYRPRDDGRPDPGEIVWAWVPFEEADGRGKDRPVLVVGRDGEALLGLMLTSRDHDRDAADEARRGRHWVDIGSGAWDRRGRPSEVRVDRVLRLAAGDVRREGATLDRARFDVVATEVRRLHGR